MKLIERGIHFVTAVPFLLCTLVGWIWLPTLWRDVPTAFSSLCGFATLYGVLFAIIEVMRTKSVANIAAQSADNATIAVNSLYGLKDKSECILLIETALASIERDGIAQSSLLSRIVKIYSAIYHQEQNDDKSPQRINVAMIESYTSLNRPAQKSTGKLKQSLISMTQHLSASIGKTTSKGQAL